MKVEGKNVFITGGSRGIGFATARAFLERDARIFVISKSPESTEAAVIELGEEHGEENVFGIQADVRDKNDVHRAVKQAIKKFGSIDILINNAGVAWMGSFHKQEFENIDYQIETNLLGVIYASRTVLPYMLENKEGVIVNVASGAGLRGIARLAVYSASKFGVIGFTQALSGEVSGDNVRVYGVCPGAVATDMQEEIMGEKAGMSPDLVAQSIVSLVKSPDIEEGGCLVM